VRAGRTQRPALRWTYAELQAQANRIARVLVDDLGLVPGNRVLLRGANSPMMAACWFGVIKAGGIAVGTMPLLRERELQPIVDKAQVSARAVRRAAGRRAACAPQCPTLQQLLLFNGDGGAGRWRRRWPRKPPTSTPSTPRPTTPA
jgi:2-aminobenzoate-CoA ligase